MRRKFGTLTLIAIAVLLLGLSTGVLADGEQPEKKQAVRASSEPPAYERDPDFIGPPKRSAVQLPETLGPAAPSLPSAPLAATDLVIFGLNFQGSQLNVDSGFIPPDTMGAVGPDHIVELINGRYDVYDKATGNQIATQSLDGFWTNVVGLTIPPFNDTCAAGTCSVSGGACIDDSDCLSNGTFDPRIVYDIPTGRWFAVSLDRTNPATGDNNIYVARTDTSDPTGDWDGGFFDADTVGGGEFHDYETLAVDADGLYMCTQDFGGGGNESCYSIPKADLLAAVPSIANMTRFEATVAPLPTVDGSIQPALDFGPSDGRAAYLGTSGGALVRGNILGAGGPGATLSPVVGVVGDPGHAAPPPARQPAPDPTATLENVAPRFVSNVFEQGSSLWAVHAVAGTAGNSALRWYEIDEPSSVLLQTGLIDDPNQDFHEPSIVVNEFGDAVIGYTCSGPALSPSACVSVGDTVAGVTTFEAPFIVRNGNGYYWRDFRNPPDNERNRWGDYSATVLDPVDACTFWTFQEFVAVSAVGDVGPSPKPEGGSWGIQITQMQFKNCADVDLEVTKTDNRTTAVPGLDPIDYVITVTNAGTSHALDATVTDAFPGDLSNCSWTCTPSAGSTCTTGPAFGNISDTVDIPVGGSLTYNASCTLDPFAVGVLSNTAMATPAAGITDADPGDNIATDVTTLTPKVDLAVAKSDGVKKATPGGNLTYAIFVANAGPSGVTGATVADPFPAVLTCTWTCTASAGSSCTAGPVVGDLLDFPSIAPSGLLTYSATCAIDPMAMGWLTNTVGAFPPAGVEELNPADNLAVDDDTGLSDYFSVLQMTILNAMSAEPGAVLKIPTGGTSVSTLVSFLPPYVNLTAMDVQPSNDVYFAVDQDVVVAHAPGWILLEAGTAYLYTAATGVIAPAAAGAGLNVTSIDGLDEVGGALIFSVATTQTTTHAGGLIVLKQQNAYLYNAGTISLALDGEALFLSSLDALEFLSPTAYGFSTSLPQAVATPFGLVILFPQNAYIVDTATGAITLEVDGAAFGNPTLDALTLAQGKD